MFKPSEIQVLFQDSALLVVNKPAGLSTLPDGYNPSLPHVKSVLELQAGRLWIVHRLDKDTSGVLLLARSAEAHRSLNTQFEQHQVTKLYHALVKGNPVWHEKTIDLPLRPNGDRSHRTVVDPVNGKSAITCIKVLEAFGRYCLLEAAPQTGRTHQIRAHLSYAGFSILGDKLYGERKQAAPTENESRSTNNIDRGKISIAGMGLHARSLEFNHPVFGKRVKFEAPYPAWWEEVLEGLRTMSHQEKDVPPAP